MSESIRAAISLLLSGSSLPASLAQSTMREIMSGTATDAQKGAFLTALSLERLTPQVVAACADVMRAHALPCEPGVDAIDVVGTGGDGIDTFNVSTAASIVVAAAGGKVLKHGNRSNSSKCGSADILEALGANLHVDGPQAVEVMRRTGFCFLFAQKFHPAMRHVGGVRRQLGVRTVFNILGPLTNPARAQYYVTGVFHMSLGRLFAETFLHLKVKRAMVVHSAEGLDELSPAGITHAWIVENGTITERDLSPTDFGLPTHSLDLVMGGEPEENVDTFRRVLGGEPGPVSDYIALNAAAAIWIAGMADTLEAAAVMAKEAISSGKAKEVLDGYVRFSNEVAQEPAASDPSAPSILTEIATHRRDVVTAAAKKATPLPDLLSSYVLGDTPPAIDVVDRLTRDGGVSIMAEIKRASPSKGIINDKVVPADQALRYAEAGAAVISVLTEPKWFKGSLADLEAVATRLRDVPNRPAVLLKDFVMEEYQLVEARAHGADTALLIVALLDDETLQRLMLCARKLGMEPLVEVASEEEMTRALAVGARFIGVNNRDLHTFEVDMDRTTRLAQLIPDDTDVVLAALSGIKTADDVSQYASNGARAMLVGETLMRADDPAAKIRELLGGTMAKICGLRDAESALVAADAGADFLGVIFAKSKRQVTPEQAATIVSAVRAKYPLHADIAAALAGHSSRGLSWQRRQANTLANLVLRQKQRPLVVGVFMDQTAEEINAAALTSGIDLIQLHGSEGFQFAAQLCRPVVRVMHVFEGTSPEAILEEVEFGLVSALLLDTAVRGSSSGGTGKTFDWDVARAVGQQVPIMVAGGLTPENVGAAIAQVHPWAVDVSSGVETDGPHKDHGKIREFVRVVKSIE